MWKKLPDVGPLEMQILGIVASGNEASVSDIQKSLKRKGQELAYTTVMTVLARLYNKGLVKRRKEGRLYLYFIDKKNHASPTKLLEKVKKTLFGSEKLKPILGLLDAEEHLSKEELKELRRAIDEKLKRIEP